ncbi:MAG: hypothetical protein AAFY71_28165 [Bacteroidota bacterium]
MSLLILACIFVLTLLLTYTLGGILLYSYQFHSDKPIRLILIQFFLGFIGVSTFASVVFAYGNTLNLLFVLMAGLLLWNKQKIESESSFEQDKKLLSHYLNLGSLGILIILGLAFFLLQVLVTNVFLDWPFFSINRDNIYYSILAEFISVTGKEAFQYDWYNSPENLGFSPYHWVEIWFTSFYSLFGSFPLVYIFGYVTLPILNALMFITILALLENTFGTKKWYSLLWIAFPLMGAGVISEFLPTFYKIHPSLLFAQKKFILAFVIVSLAYFSLIKKDLNEFCIIISGLIAINIGFLPIVLGLYVLIPLCNRFIFKETYNYSLPIVFASFLGFLGILAFKVMQQSDFGEGKLGESFSVVEYYQTLPAIKEFIQTMIFMGLDWLPFLIPVLALIFLPYLFKDKISFSGEKYWIIAILVSIAGVIGGAFLHFIVDGVQVNSMIEYPIQVLVSTIVIAMIWKESQHLVSKILVCVFLVFFTINLGLEVRPKDSIKAIRLQRYSKEFLTSLVENKDELKGFGGRYYTDFSIYTSAWSLNPNTDFEGFATNFLHFGNMTHTLTLFQIPERDPYFERQKAALLPSTYFFQYGAQRDLETPEQILNMQISFIKDEKLTFLWVKDQASVPEELKNLYEKRLTDSKSGETVFFDPKF